jgi:hypothetical protein
MREKPDPQSHVKVAKSRRGVDFHCSLQSFDDPMEGHHSGIVLADTLFSPKMRARP